MCYNKMGIEQNIAPMRSTNFSLNGNNDLMDGSVEYKQIISNSNSNNLMNTNLNNNISNKK